MWINMSKEEADRLVWLVESGEDNPYLRNIVTTIKGQRAGNQDPEDAQEMIERARKEHHVDGVCEIDDEATVSWADKGAYVMAWVWLDDETVEPDQGDIARCEGRYQRVPGEAQA